MVNGASQTRNDEWRNDQKKKNMRIDKIKISQQITGLNVKCMFIAH